MASRCEALRAQDFTQTPDAPTRIHSARLVEAAGAAPAYCELTGNIAPQVGILARLPAETWNGRFLQVGCGGFCGITTFIAMCDQPLQRGYACITTDMGHRGLEVEGVEWAYNNPAAVTDFAYRATHVTALAGKAIIERYYGRQPERSYFHGCSCGGRQALIEAERYPEDFDGIIVGAPAISYTDVSLTSARKVDLLLDRNGAPLFDAASIATISAAIIAECDMNDGVRDGQIGDPRICRFDPRRLICRGRARSNCLTRAQGQAAWAFYHEERTPSGERVGERAFSPGWESGFFGLAMAAPLTQRAFYEDYFKYLALTPAPGPTWRFEDFDLTRDRPRLEAMNALMEPQADLSAFSAAGGRMIMYHGWNDGGISPQTSVAYYEGVERSMGGRAATQSFMRLFMVPDMDHCMGGRGPWAIDYLTYLERWVEHGEAPDALIGAHFTDNPMSTEPVDYSTPRFTRPIYPYPLRAEYSGAGDPTSAASFQAVNP
ncbi:MAG: tannase/feruloyl esterase family alpha/beta hydrolase [Hyphomonadaceae bacterium JAD_PAG50586_4]|nr:MAG: tannase/feruloyl esterase family alpha/beta hydrolase [Hyphomonadaceae bacterium JAD_PAG50586_4]